LKIIIHFLFFLVLIGPTNALSSVWKDDKKWDLSWEKKYSNWVAGPEVTLDIFTDPQKKYYGITADCADAVYALRAIFSYENGLPFSFVNPHFKNKTLFSNRTSKFNRIKKGPKRLKAFLNYIGIILSTYHLGKNDTYPVKIDHLRPGDLYIFQLKTRKMTLKHVMVIKSINPNGTFNFIYSSQRIKRLNEAYFKGKGQGHGLMLKKNQDSLYSPQHDIRGFRRFINPKDMLSYPRNFKKNPSYWREHFKVSKKWGEKKFLLYIKKNILKKREDINLTLQRKLNDLCELSKQRVDAVNEVHDFLKNKKVKCLNFKEFDIYSTPMLDFIIKKHFHHLQYTWENRKKENITPQILSTLLSLFKKGEEDDYCPVEFLEGSPPLSFSHFYSRLSKGLLSYDPHENKKMRWGEKKGPRQKLCKVFY
jgi:hypothetical protein